MHTRLTSSLWLLSLSEQTAVSSRILVLSPLHSYRLALSLTLIPERVRVFVERFARFGNVLPPLFYPLQTGFAVVWYCI